MTLVKSTEVALATERVEGLSIRNRLPGTVTAPIAGSAMASVGIAVESAALTAVVTKEAAEDLGLAVGAPVVALIKSTEVSLAAPCHGERPRARPGRPARSLSSYGRAEGRRPGWDQSS